ncbi:MULTISPECIES: alcohol dehydrogenase catalytic domain-containing protein [unclassified Leucobacter]|uniref:alcohol dehydrogenase catalytic domain-containing protein n=1 Tax=unclassified Leucobacter TaxID=2621730 RepID=UPI00165D3E0C|nr:alcohol dehydrogenase catalytic domain-containing protein [Leucobacter sp. CX169]MBC9926278.1 alcohol dehydrogenase catalytic domain-containing protein [Leucobacter sp. cx-169]
MKIYGAVLEAVGRPRPFASSQPISISELSLAAPGPSEVLVRIESAGLCHSDLSVVDGNRPRPVPMLLGHEAAGIVEAFGGQVSDLAVGDRVVLTFLPRCGKCDGCLAGGRLPCEPGTRSNTLGTLFEGDVRLSRDGEPVAHHLGVSGFASHAVVDYRSLVRVDSDVPAEVAALLGCAVLTGGGAVLNEARLQPGQRTIVVGLGGVGMAALMTAIAVGQGPVIGVDMNPEKLELARQLGAIAAFTPQEMLAAGETADCVIEAAGSAPAFETAVQLTAPGGKTITVGLPHADARSSISPLGLVAEARTIVGCYLGSALPQRDIPIFAEFWRSGRLPVERLVSSHISLDGLNEAMDLLAEGRALRQMITFPMPGETSQPAPSPLMEQLT